jgi:TatA/E family protein of Tat protein translocase
MFGSLGLPEILLILVVALLIFGPKRLPEVGRTIGKGLGEFRRASADLKRTVNAELALDDDERSRTARRPEPPRVAAAPSGSSPGAGPAPPVGVAAREPAGLGSASGTAPEPGAGDREAGEDPAEGGEPAEAPEAPGPTEPVTTH